MKTFVVVPVGGDTLRLRWCLAGLERQGDSDFATVIAIDGKDEATSESIAEVLADFMGTLSLNVLTLPMHPDSFRPSETRNLVTQVATQEEDLLIFLDADCVPDPDFVAAHKEVQKEFAGCRVVFGFRRHLPEPSVMKFQGADWLAGNGLFAILKRNARMEARQHCLPENPSHWDVWSCNLSIHAGVFAAVGGFDLDYDGGYGGCDTDLAARLIRAGCDLVPLTKTGFVTHLDHPKQWESVEWAEANVQAARDGSRPMVANGKPLGLGAVKGTGQNES